MRRRQLHQAIVALTSAALLTGCGGVDAPTAPNRNVPATEAPSLVVADAAATLDRELAGGVLLDPYVSRLVGSLEGPDGEAARDIFAQAMAAFASSDVAGLRGAVSALRPALQRGLATPDRAIVGVLDLYVMRLEEATGLATSMR